MFRPGRAKNDVLGDVQWRGAFLGACDDDGTSIMAVGFQIYPDRPVESGVAANAIFINDRFQKFVPWQSGRELGISIDDPQGVYMSIPKPRRTDDCGWLIQHAAHPAFKPDDLQKELAELRPEPPYGGFDPHELRVDEKRNVELRGQFNAARLSIGMPETEVRSILKSEPLEAGKVEGSNYEIFGSTEILNIRQQPGDEYSNILVLYREGKVRVIHRVEIGLGPNYYWRQSLSELFTDLPRPDH